MLYLCISLYCAQCDLYSAALVWGLLDDRFLSLRVLGYAADTVRAAS